jgi:hypothetical protein
MPDADNVSNEELRKAVLNVADAIRLTSEALDRLALRLSLSIPSLELDPFLPNLRESIRAANGRLSAAVDLANNDE